MSWSPDGKYILFDTGQRTEERRIARVDLVPRTPRFREDQFRELFQEPGRPSSRAHAGRDAGTGSGDGGSEAAPSKVDVQVVAEGIRNRLTLIPAGVDVGWQTISPDGKQLLMIAEAAGQTNLWLYSLDELARGGAGGAAVARHAAGSSRTRGSRRTARRFTSSRAAAFSRSRSRTAQARARWQ